MNKSFAFLKNPCNGYLFLWCIYLLQGSFYEKGTLFSQSILLLILLISLKHIKYACQSNEGRVFFKLLLALIVLYTIHGLLLFLEGGYTFGRSNQSIAVSFLRSFYASVLPMYTFFCYAKKGYLTLDSLRIWIYMFIFLGIVLFYRYQRDALEQMQTNTFEEVTNNAGYVMIALIPSVFVIKKQWLQIVLLGLCIVFTISSMKRGAILIGCVLLLMYLRMKTQQMKISNEIVFCLIVILVGFVLYDFLDRTVFQSSYFQYRMERTLEGSTSGRDELISACINFYFNDENIFQQMFGLGPNGTLSIAGNGAHNDWMELLVNQGFLGLLIFLFFWISFFKCTRIKSLSLLSRNALTLVFVICFLRSFFSQSINDISIFLSSVFGLAMLDGLAGCSLKDDR